MSRDTALLTFGIGPVHSFIAQARRVADVWAGSYLLSHLTRQAIAVVHGDPDCEMVFPFLSKGPIPDGMPNRFVARVPRARADEIAQHMRDEVQRVWEDTCVSYARRVLERHGLSPEKSIWSQAPQDGRPRQTDTVLDCYWSWVPERGDYAMASHEGARRYAAARRFRPFAQIEQNGEKCAICGERTALPNGERESVQKAWNRAAEATEDHPEERFFRFDQGRLCLVCATKRLFPVQEGRGANFEAFDKFQSSEEAPYFALVKMDADHMGDLLDLGPDAIADGDLESFHREVSAALVRFAKGLKLSHSAALNLSELGGYQPQDEQARPQLIYAGGDDVLFVCAALDAIPLAQRLHDRFSETFETVSRRLNPESGRRFSVSAAVLFAHPKHPAGLLLHDLEDLLKRKAKTEAGRNAVALRLAKRGGPPVEVAFRWDEPEKTGWIKALNELVGHLRQGELSSHQTFSLRLEERTLRSVFTKPEQWQGWLADRLSRNESTDAKAQELAGLIAPFFLEGRTEVLRIVRFLGRELNRDRDR